MSQSPPPQITVSGSADVHPLADLVHAAITLAINGEARVADHVTAMAGMSGQKYRGFISHLIRNLDDARYLEVGSWMGSTFCSAIDGNHVRALSIDNWSEFGGPQGAFFSNVSKCVSAQTRVSVSNSDFRLVTWGAIGTHNVYLFDGPHTAKDQHDGLALALPALDDVFVFIVDDWNWREVREGTREAVNAGGLKELFSIEILSTTNDVHPGEQGLPVNEASDWHNGYYIAVLSKS